MQTYSVRDIERVLHLSRSTIRGLIDVGFVTPTRGPRREYRFSFQDLIVLRAARALIQAKVSRRRIRRSLEDLRKHLPETMPNRDYYLKKGEKFDAYRAAYATYVTKVFELLGNKDPAGAAQRVIGIENKIAAVA